MMLRNDDVIIPSVRDNSVVSELDALAQTADFKALIQFLPCATPEQWTKQAPQQLDMLLINHAYLEKCAARTAMGFMFRYPDCPHLLQKMSRLAREELVHFEQVCRLLRHRGLQYASHKPSAYAGRLKQAVSNDNYKAQRVDSLIVAAFIEARSCERFYCLAQVIDDSTLARFYLGLLQSEMRHFRDYITLAEQASEQSIESRIAYFADIESQYIQAPDPLFRLHSGVPV